MTIFDYAPLSFWRKERRRWWFLQKNGLEYMPWKDHMRRECQGLRRRPDPIGSEPTSK